MTRDSDDEPTEVGSAEDAGKQESPGGTAPERRAITSEEAEEAENSVSVLFGILADQRQRYVLYNLIKHGGQARLGDLAKQLAAAENRTSIELATEEMVTRVRAGLYHADLPKLEDYGFVEWDAETGLVTLTEKTDEIEQHVKLAREMEGEANAYLEYLDQAIEEITTETEVSEE